MFYDEVKIYVKAGDGGNGAAMFRREKYVPFGGPSGGDGGKGGDIVLEVDTHLNTLYMFAHHPQFLADNGENGRNKDQYGAAGKDMVILVPPGTMVRDAETGELLADLTEKGTRYVVARGGRGGRGNKHFVTSNNRAPRIAEHGEPGEDRWIHLELKLLADVGLVGKPNAGKSTLLAATTAAKPAIADYPFTTLHPILGVVALSTNNTFVLADLPGLIEGASEGKGLGLEFLKHIERTRILLHLLDGSAEDPIEDFTTINAELAAFGHGLAERPQIVAVNKLDIPEAREAFPTIKEALEKMGYEVWGISGATTENLRPLLGRAYQLLQETPPPPAEEIQTPVFRPEPEEPVVVERDYDGIWRVTNGKIERAVRRTPLNMDDALMRLHRYLEHQGVLSALRKAGVQEGDLVRIGDYELEWREEE